MYYGSHLAPGGYIEFQDHSATLFDGSKASAQDLEFSNPLEYAKEVVLGIHGNAFERWWALVVQAGRHAGRDFQIALCMRDILASTGFVDITVRREVWPVTRWPENPAIDEVGRWGALGMSEALDSYSIAVLTRVLNWSLDDVKKLISDARKEMRNKENRYCTEA